MSKPQNFYKLSKLFFTSKRQSSGPFSIQSLQTRMQQQVDTLDKSLSQIRIGKPTIDSGRKRQIVVIKTTIPTRK